VTKIVYKEILSKCFCGIMCDDVHAVKNKKKPIKTMLNLWDFLLGADDVLSGDPFGDEPDLLLQ